MRNGKQGEKSHLDRKFWTVTGSALLGMTLSLIRVSFFKQQQQKKISYLPIYWGGMGRGQRCVGVSSLNHVGLGDRTVVPKI